MFSDHIKNDTKRLLIRKLKRKKGILKNTIKCSEFRHANYTFVHSFKNENSFESNKFQKTRRIYD